MEKIGKLSFNRAQLLGAGRFGKIFVGKYKNSLEVAIKRVEKSETEMDSTLYMKVNGHPNIIQYYGDSSKDVEFRYLAVEICCGNLEDLIKQKYDGPTVGSTLEILHQIAKGVHHLHLLDIVHGDLKPSNVLVSCSKGDLKPMMKLTDFGLRHVVQRDCSNGEKQFRQAKTKGWFCTADQVDGQLSPSFDIFPLGNLFYYTASKGTHAFGSSLRHVMSRMKKKKPVILDLGLLDESVRCAAFLALVGKMLYFDAGKRPSASEIVDHEIFNKDQKDFLNRPSTSRLSTQSALEEDKQSDRLPAECNPEPSSSSQSRVIVKHEDFGSSEEDEISHPHKKRRIPQPLVRDYDYESSGSSSTQQSGTKKSKGIKLKTSNIKEEASTDPVMLRIKKEKEDSDEANKMNIPSAGDQRGQPVATESSFSSKQLHNDFSPQSVEQDRYSSASYQSRHSQSSLDSKDNDRFPSQLPYQGMANNSQPYIQVRPFQRGSCSKSFSNPMGLTAHQRKVHLPPSYRCNFCHRLFQRPDHLKSHINVDKYGFVYCLVLRKQLSHSNSNS